MISGMFMPVCNCFHARRANIGKITTFREVILFDACVRTAKAFLNPYGIGM